MGWLYFQGCTSQNIYLGVALIIALVLVFAIGMMFTFVLKPTVPLTEIMKKYRWIASIVLVIVFVLAFVINNTLFWYYCSSPTYWGTYKPYVLWFVIVPLINIVIFGLTIWVMYALMENEVSKHVVNA